jgi:ABC-2 type transport system permease protein
VGNLWRIARAEYLRLAAKRSFLLSIIGMPLLIGAIMAIAVITAMPKGDARPIGYVDLAGVMQDAPAQAYAPGEDAPVLAPFADEDAAAAALEAGAIQAYYVVPADYLATRSLSLVTWDESPAPGVRQAFEDLLEAHLVAQAPQQSQKVLLEGMNLIYRGANDRRELPVEGFVVGTLLPFVIGFFFIMVVMSSGGYLLRAVTTEKENRMVEVMMTTVSPLTLIGGKAVGLIGVALTQILVWLIALAVGLAFASKQVPWLSDLPIPGTTLLFAALYFLPTYVLLAGMMITVGSMVTELQYGQQIAGYFNLLFLMPFFFIVLLFSNPDSPIMVALTLFPTTSMLTLAMRWGVTQVPAWQIGVSFVLLLASALVSIWVAARVFRLGMLRYGQPLSFAGLVDLLRPGRTASGAAK